MYKELRDSIKEFNPGEDELKDILSRVANSSLSHRGQNRDGEIYEKWVYEYLKSWALSCDSVKAYLNKLPERSDYPLTYDTAGQIIYIKNGKKLAEYDGLFIYRDKVVFVESSISDLRSYFKNLEKRLIEKRKLLVDLFKTEEVYYLLVTRPKKRTLVYRSLPNLILYKLKSPDLTIANSRASDLKSSKLLTANRFISSFSSS